MSARRLHICTLLLVSVMLAACGSSDRPRELSMDDVHPCDLVSADDLERLEMNAGPQPITVIPGVLNAEGVSCRYFVTTANAVNNTTVGAITNFGLDRWTNGDVEGAIVEDVPSIRGFHTIKVGYTYSRGGPHDECTLYVDVADGQSLMIAVNATTDKTAPPTCETARQFAEAAMKTLTK